MKKPAGEPRVWPLSRGGFGLGLPAGESRHRRVNAARVGGDVIVGQRVRGLGHDTISGGAANTSYSLFMDGGLLNQGTFVLTDARGMNAVELEQSGESKPSPTALGTVDDLRIVPEPAAGLLPLLRRRPSEWSPPRKPSRDLHCRLIGRSAAYLAAPIEE